MRRPCTFVLQFETKMKFADFCYVLFGDWFSSGMYLVILVNQGHGLVPTVSTFESFRVPLVEEEATPHAQTAESRGRGWIALNAKERYSQRLIASQQTTTDFKLMPSLIETFCVGHYDLSQMFGRLCNMGRINR